MALDRQSIEKRDFPIGRRGYEPEAVDAHLAQLADEIDGLQRSSRQRTESLASAASKQVQAIVEAAERSAASIESEASDDATETRRKAGEDAEATRSDAAAQAREHVDKVSQASATMLQRVDAMETELGALIESLRAGGDRLNSDLALLQQNMGELSAVGRGQGGANATADFGADEDEAAEQQLPDTQAAVEAEAEPTSAGPPEADAASDEGGDGEGARLVALNMALNGSSREETAGYLAEHYNLEDTDSLLDEVYAQVQ